MLKQVGSKIWDLMVDVMNKLLYVTNRVVLNSFHIICSFLQAQTFKHGDRQIQNSAIYIFSCISGTDNLTVHNW
jgi:hypothetical protein